MECSCKVEIYPDGDDGPSLFKSEMITAKKAHKCTECRNQINSGEKYEKVDGVWDGSWDHFKTCQDCLSLRDEFFIAGYTFGWLWDDFFEDMCRDIPESCISNLTGTARDRVCDYVEKHWRQ